MIDAKEMFNKYQPLVEKFVWNNARRFQVDPDDVRGEAYILFCIAAQRYDAQYGASFGTYLYHRLHHLSCICKDMRFNREIEFVQTNAPDKLRALFDQSMERLESALELSSDAQQVLDFILSWEWDVPGGRKRLPRLSLVANQFRHEANWSVPRTQKAWEEIKTWWRTAC